MDNFMTSRQGWQKDISAGITVGVVAVPLAMAFAIASGVGPVYGLYTAIIAGILVSLFGGSTFQIAGPTGAFIPIVSGVMLAHGYEGLLVTTFLAGILLFLMSVLRVGRLIRFMPRAVTIGFTAGIAVVIFVDQLDELFGITFEKAPHFHENFLKLVTTLPEASLWPIMIAAIGFLTLWLLPKLPVKLPLLLMAMLVPTFVSLVIPGEVATIGSAYGGIPSGLPEFNWLAIDLDLIGTLLPSAFAIAFLGALESLLSGAVADGMAGTKMNPDKELFGQGLANVVVPFFGGIPATGAIARTAT
ncbi:SulP family inorganic anion transporter, partial [Exiguobacterium alkaliphilum]